MNKKEQNWLPPQTQTAFDRAILGLDRADLELRASGVSPQVAAMLLQAAGWSKISGRWRPTIKTNPAQARELAQGLLLSTTHGQHFLKERLQNV